MIYCFGEILWDCYPDISIPGGAPMNVAIHAEQFGGQSCLISSVGADAYGDKLLEYIHQRTKGPHCIQAVTDCPTGLVKVNISTDKDADVTYTIGQPAAWDYINLADTLPTLSEEDVLVYGTLSTRHEVSRNTLIELKKGPAFNVCDLNLREPFYSKEIIDLALEGTDLLKVNRAEFKLLCEWYDLGYPPQEAALKLFERTGIQYLCVTSGSQGSLLYSKTEQWKSQVYEVVALDPVGSGDAFLASLIVGMRVKQNPIQQIINQAAAIGALVATKRGATPVITQSEIDLLMSKPALHP